ncbi:MAG: hypothetical protein JXL97_20150 [Bacteroidales bacterium]|nr:hypothetical protein [Bacteroidales bacterium]
MNKLKNQILGLKDFVLKYQSLKKSWGGELNNQAQRKKIFETIVKNIHFDFVFETGTYRGTTTEYFYQITGKKVISVEINPRYYFFSYLRFFFNSKVKIINNDSRKVLTKIAKNGNHRIDKVFFYLDAHWNNDLPLKEELNIILSGFPNAMIMIDDFKVPWDDGYGFDDYGVNKILDVNYLSSIIKENIYLFFPYDSKNETGAKRGTLFLTNNSDFKKVLEKIELLKQYQ